MAQKYDLKSDEVRTTLVSSLEQLSTVCDALEKRITAKFDKLTKDTVGVAHQNSGKIEQLDGTLVKCMQETELMSSMIEKIDSRVNAHYAHHNKATQQIIDDCTPRFLALEATTQETNRKVNENNENVTAICSELNVKFTNKVEGLEVMTSGIRDDLEDRHKTVTTFCASLDKTVQDQHAHFVSLHEGIENKLSAHMVDIVKRVDYEHENFTSICSALDQKTSESSLELSEKISLNTDSITDNKRQFTSICDGMDTKFTQQTMVLSQKHDDLTSKVQEVADTIPKGDIRLEGMIKAETRRAQDALAEQGDLIAERYKKLEERHAERVHLQDQRVEELVSTVTENNQRLTQANNAVDQKFSACVSRLDGSLKDIAETIEKNHRQGAQHYARIEKKLEEATAPLPGQIDHIRQHFTERCDETAQALRLSESELKAATEALGLEFAATSNALSRTAEVDKKEHTRRLDRLETGLAEASDRFVAELAAVTRKTSEETAALADRIVNHTKHFAGVVANVEHNFAEKHSYIVRFVTPTSRMCSCCLFLAPT